MAGRALPNARSQRRPSGVTAAQPSRTAHVSEPGVRSLGMSRQPGTSTKCLVSIKQVSYTTPHYDAKALLEVLAAPEQYCRAKRHSHKDSDVMWTLLWPLMI